MMMVLTDSQMLQVKQAAALLPTYQRDGFLRSVSNRLADLKRITDADVSHAIDFILSCRGISAPVKRR